MTLDMAESIIESTEFMLKMNKPKRIICWWSGGITSAVACKLALDLFK
jgi:hypothetical protein